MKYSLSIATALLAATATAFPSLPPQVLKRLAEVETADALEKRQSSARQTSREETNCGPDGPCSTFDAAEQFVSITGVHAYQSPTAGQIRGPCPGLNAAANHNYLPRSGVPSILQTIQGLGEAYGMSVDLAGFLAAYAVVFDGDLVSGTWSIGGPQPYTNLGGLLSPPQGISYSHNKYEGDSSIGRNDAYLNGGNAYSLNVTRFAFAYETGLDNDRYTLDKFRRDIANNQLRSIENNPYYFAPLFSTTLVSPAAYNFVINFMSNHSAAEPSGYLNGAMFKEFFAVTGDYPNFKWLPGQEKIPKNWYRRPTADSYNAVNVFQDLIIMFEAYPNTFRFGGNTGKTNSYVGIDPFELTGTDAYNSTNLFKGNNFACFFFETQQQAVPDELKGLYSSITPALQLLGKYSNPIFKAFDCPKLAKYDSSLFNQFPGRNYNPQAPPNN